jgi:hypothetical protein
MYSLFLSLKFADAVASRNMILWTRASFHFYSMELNRMKQAELDDTTFQSLGQEILMWLNLFNAFNNCVSIAWVKIRRSEVGDGWRGWTGGALIGGGNHGCSNDKALKTLGAGRPNHQPQPSFFCTCIVTELPV